jgi:hypothetical protein
VVYCLFAYIRAKHFEFSPSYGCDPLPKSNSFTEVRRY